MPEPYRALSPEDQIIESGVVIASGEANFADFSGVASPSGYYFGINQFLTSGYVLLPNGEVSASGELLGIIYTAPANSSIYLQTGLEGEASVSGIINSILSSGVSALSGINGVFSYVGDYQQPDLSVFNSYIHYYPQKKRNTASALGATIDVPFRVDYSFIFQPSVYYNTYSPFNYDVYNNSGTFPDGIGIPQSRFKGTK